MIPNFDLNDFGTEEPTPERLLAHYKRCEHLLVIYIEKYEELEEVVKNNTAATEALKDEVTSLKEATEGLVSVWTTANNVQKFIKWISSIGLLGIVITWIGSKLPSSWFS